MIAFSRFSLDYFSTPSSQILYEGDRTTLVCHVNGNAFWQLNGTIYSELNAVFFESRGITSFDSFVGDSGLNTTLTIVGSVLNNNNTVIRCISVQQNGITNTSDAATITVLGMCHCSSKCMHPSRRCVYTSWVAVLKYLNIAHFVGTTGTCSICTYDIMA